MLRPGEGRVLPAHSRDVHGAQEDVVVDFVRQHLGPPPLGAETNERHLQEAVARLRVAGAVEGIRRVAPLDVRDPQIVAPDGDLPRGRETLGLVRSQIDAHVDDARVLVDRRVAGRAPVVAAAQREAQTEN